MPPLPTRATILIEGAPVTILPRRAPVGSSGPIRGRTLAVFSGAPPSTLSGRRGALYSATLEPDAAPGFAVPDLDEAEAADLGRALGQAEVLFWDGRRARLLTSTAQSPPLP